MGQNTGVGVEDSPYRRITKEEAATVREIMAANKLPGKPTLTDSATFSDQGQEWDVEGLICHARTLKEEWVLVSSLEETLDSAIWEEGRMTVREVADHTRRIMEADRSFPILFSAEGVLMDGAHRLARAWLEGDKYIRAVRFPVTPPCDRIRPREVPVEDAGTEGRGLPLVEVERRDGGLLDRRR